MEGTASSAQFMEKITKDKQPVLTLRVLLIIFLISLIDKGETNNYGKYQIQFSNGTNAR